MFRGAGVDATYLEVKSRLGHYATTEEPDKWTHEVKELLRDLAIR